MRWAIWWHMPVIPALKRQGRWLFENSGHLGLPCEFQASQHHKAKLSLKEKSGEWLKIPDSDFWLLYTYSDVIPPTGTDNMHTHVFTHKLNEKPYPLLMFTPCLCSLPVIFMCIRLSSHEYAGTLGCCLLCASLLYLYIVFTSLLLVLQT